MANNPTAPSIELTTVWTDLYAESGIAVGTQVLISNRGKQVAYLAESVAEPVVDGIILYPIKQMIADEGSPGLWARTDNANSRTLVVVQVDEVP